MPKVVGPTDPVDIQSVMVVIYGEPGVGKSSVGFSAKNAISFDLDEGAHRSKFRENYVLFDGWKDFRDNWKRLSQGYSTIVIDVVDKLLEHIKLFLQQSSEKGMKDKRQVYGKLKEIVSDLLTELHHTKKDIVLICHAGEFTDQNETLMKRPKITGGSYDLIIQKADFLGYMSMMNGKVMLDFSPKDYAVGKNSANFPAIEITEWPEGEKPTFLADLMQQMKDSINAASNSMVVTRQQEADAKVLSEKIAATEAIADLNVWLKEAAKFNTNRTLRRKIWESLQARAAQIEAVYDTETKAFKSQYPSRPTTPVDNLPKTSVHDQSIEDWVDDYTKEPEEGA